MRWIVDGMNVIGTRPDGWWKDRHGAMVRLVDLLERFAAEPVRRSPSSSRAPLPADQIPRRQVPPCAASGPNSADAEIVRRLRADPDPAGIRVVTSDRALADQARFLDALVEPAEAFRRRAPIGVRREVLSADSSAASRGRGSGRERRQQRRADTGEPEGDEGRARVGGRVVEQRAGPRDRRHRNRTPGQGQAYLRTGRGLAPPRPATRLHGRAVRPRAGRRSRGSRTRSRPGSRRGRRWGSASRG